MTASPIRPLAAALLALACLTHLPAARADALTEAQQLLKQGQHQQALERTEQVLTSKPKDAQARFLKGLILTEMNRPADAIAVFQKLTEDYPELPEPYNNLAVIYAQQRQYDKAKTALEMAIRTHPSYATAHENLGDIYARLASQAYDKALQLDSSNTAAQNKLAMIRELMGSSARPAASKTAATTSAAKPAAAPPPPPAAPAPKAEPAAPAPAAAESKPAPEKADQSKPAAAASAGAAPDQAAIAKAVQDWAAAWSRKDVKGYLGSYARDFQTPGGQARGAWEKERQRRIGKPGRIEVQVENLQIKQDGPERALVKYRQHYRSAGFKTSSNKALVLIKRDGRWLIQQERVGG